MDYNKLLKLEKKLQSILDILNKAYWQKKPTPSSKKKKDKTKLEEQTIDYSAHKPDYEQIERDAPTIDYKKLEAEAPNKPKFKAASKIKYPKPTKPNYEKIKRDAKTIDYSKIK